MNAIDLSGVSRDYGLNVTITAVTNIAGEERDEQDRKNLVRNPIRKPESRRTCAYSS